MNKDNQNNIKNINSNKKNNKTREDFFYTNHMNLSYGGSNILFYVESDLEKKYFSIQTVTNMLSSRDSYHKRNLINKLSEYFYNTNGIYSSMIEKSVGIMCFDRIVTRGSSAENKIFYLNILRKISDEFVGRGAFRSCLKYGDYYGYLSYLQKNDTGDGTEEMIDGDYLKTIQFSDVSVTPLNPKYIRVLSTDGKTHRIGIDLSMLHNNDLLGLPKEIFNDVKSSKNSYDKDDKKTKNKQYYILDEKKTLVIRLGANSNDSCGRAPFLNAIMQLIHDNNLLIRKDDIAKRAGKKLIIETFPEGQKGKGTSALTKEQMIEQHKALEASLRGLDSNEIGFCSLFPNTKVEGVDVATSLSGLTSDDIIKRIGTHSGFSSGLLNGEDIQNDKVIPLIYEILSAEFDDFKIQWEKELNKVLANLLKESADNLLLNPYVKYLPTNRLNRDKHAEMYHKLFCDAGGSYQLYLASTGVAPEIHLDLMDEEEELGFRNKYPAHPMASTTSSQAKESKEVDNVSKEEEEDEKKGKKESKQKEKGKGDK